MYSFSRDSERKLKGVHPDLVAVTRRALELSEIDFGITQGVRSMEEQVRLKAAGASKTLRSRHIPSTSKHNPGYAHAVDVIAYLDGKRSYHGPLYFKLAKAFKAAAKELKIPIEWGGECFGPKFFDGPHFQLPWKEYP